MIIMSERACIDMIVPMRSRAKNNFMEFLLSLPVHRRRSRTFARIAWRRSLSPEHVVVDLRSSPNFSTARKKMAISEKVQGLWKTAGGPPRSVFLAHYYSAYLCVCGHPIMNYLPHPPHGNSSPSLLRHSEIFISSCRVKVIGCSSLRVGGGELGTNKNLDLWLQLVCTKLKLKHAI